MVMQIKTWVIWFQGLHSLIDFMSYPSCSVTDAGKQVSQWIPSGKLPVMMMSNKHQELLPFTKWNCTLGTALSMISFSPEESAIITQLCRRMLQLIKIKQLVEVHAGRKQRAWDWHPGCLTAVVIITLQVWWPLLKPSTLLIYPALIPVS